MVHRIARINDLTPPKRKALGSNPDGCANEKALILLDKIEAFLFELFPFLQQLTPLLTPLYEKRGLFSPLYAASSPSFKINFTALSALPAALTIIRLSSFNALSQD